MVEINTNQKIRRYISLGLNLEKNGKLNEAIKIFKKCCLIDPKLDTPHVNLAGIYLRQKKYSKAEKEYKKALLLNPKHDFAHIGIGYILLIYGEFKEAENYFRKALKLKPKNDEAHVALGWMYNDHGKVYQAKKEFVKAIEINPKNDGAHEGLGFVYLSENNYEKAKKEFLKTITMKSINAGAHVGLGDIYSIEKKFGEAVKEYNIALKISRKDDSAYNGIGSVYEAQGQWEDAIKSYKLAIKYSPYSPFGYIKLGDLYKRLVKLKLALYNYNKALSVLFEGKLKKQIEVSIQNIKLCGKLKKIGKNLNVSVVIPTYNRERLLKATLLALSKQNYPKDKYEIIVMDDGNDKTDRMIEELKIPNLRYFRIKNLGYKCVSRARNIGIKEAKNEIIIFVDSDIVVIPNFIFEHVKNHADNKSLAVIGYTSALVSKEKHNNKKIIGLVKSNYQKIIDVPIIQEYREYMYNLCSDNLNKLFTPWETFITNNVSIRRQHLIDVGMFDENFRGWGLEDIELGYRLIKEGLTFKLNRNALGYHIGTDNILNPYVDSSPEKWRNYIKNMNYFLKKFNNPEVKKTLIVHNSLIPDRFKLFKDEPKKHLLKIDNICNNNCSVCKLLNKRGKKKTFDGIKEILDTVANKNELFISGGEPTLRKDVFNIVDYAKRIGFKKVILETNGRIFCYKDFCEKMIQAGVDQFNIYLYSNDPKIHDKITRVEGSWAQTIGGIKNLREFKQDVNVIAIINNLSEKHKIKDLLNEMGIKKLWIKHYEK